MASSALNHTTRGNLPRLPGRGLAFFAAPIGARNFEEVPSWAVHSHNK